MLFSPWQLGTTKPCFEPTRFGLAQLCERWDRHDSTIVDRQRYRTIRNSIRRCARNTSRERTWAPWRNRNAAVWKDLPVNSQSHNTATHNNESDEIDDPEANGVLPTGDELYWLTVAAAVGNPTVRAGAIAAQETFRSLLTCAELTQNDDPPMVAPSYVFMPSSKSTAKPLDAITEAIHNMQSQREDPRSPISSSEASNANSDPLNTSYVQSTTNPNLYQGQQKIVDWILSNADTGKQTLTVLHGGAGTEKSFLIRELCQQMKKRGIKMINTCPTGAGACQLTAGQTFHSAFKTRPGSHLSRNTLEKMREQFDDVVGLVVVDEVSMFSSEFLVLLDGRLRDLYNPNLIFRGISTCLVGDFLQLIVLMGTPICQAMYSSSTDETIVQARALFTRYRVFFLEQRQRAESCERQQANLSDCQNLPEKYHLGQRWTKNELADFNPITDAVIQSLTTPLSNSDVHKDHAWLDETTIIVTSNTDEAALTATAVELFAKRQNVIACRWKRRLRDVDLSTGFENALYAELNYASLFVYFVPNGRAQVLDNVNGNVKWGVANGTPCRMHYLAWNDISRAETANQIIAEARRNGTRIVDLPYPPDFINVQLVDHSGDLVSSVLWPPENNLETEWLHDDHGTPPEEKEHHYTH